MSNIRLFARAGRQPIEALYSKVEQKFEDDGYAISINELVPESDSVWEVSVYVHDGTSDVRSRLIEIAGKIDPAIEIDEEILPDIDWVSHSLEGLEPVRANRVVLHGSHNKPSFRSSDISIEVDAGQAFGTGHHGTTWGCLMMIQSVLKKTSPANALDIGTGTAVLAIALAKLSRIPIVATDNDPIAIRVAAENARKNEVRSIKLLVAEGFRNREIAKHAPYDLIVANILARPLMSLAPKMTTHLSYGGDIILSGILTRQRNAVVAAYVNAGFRHIRTLESEGWVTLHLKR